MTRKDLLTYLSLFLVFSSVGLTIVACFIASHQLDETGTMSYYIWFMWGGSLACTLAAERLLNSMNSTKSV